MLPMRQKFFKNKILLQTFGAILLFLAILPLAYIGQRYHQKKIANASLQSDKILLSIDSTTANALSIETTSNAYLITGLPQFRQSYLESKAILDLQKIKLKNLLRGDRFEQQRIDSLFWYTGKKIAFIDSLIATRQKNNIAIEEAKDGTSLYASVVYRLSAAMRLRQRQHLAEQKNEAYNAIKREHRAVLGMALILLGIGGYSIIKSNFTSRKIEAMFKQHSSVLSLQINQSNDAIYTLNIHYKITSWNPGAEKLYGFSRAEALGRDSNKLLQTNLTREQINTVATEERRQHYWTNEVERKTKSGQTIIVSSSVTLIKNDAGVITGYIGVSFDITAQKMLREQVNYLASMVEQSSEAIFSIDTDRRIISWNKGAEKLFGYASHDAIGKSIAGIPFFKVSNEKLTAIEKQIEETGNWKEDIEYYRKDGTSFFGLATGNCIKNATGGVTAFYFIVKDISTRKQAEENLVLFNEQLEQKVNERTEQIAKNERRFRSILENNFDVITLMDESFKVIYRSPGAVRIFGWQGEDNKGEKVTKNIHPDDLAQSQNIIEFVINNPGKIANTLFRVKHNKGHYLWLEGIVINRLQDEDVKAIVFNYRDVTTRIEAEEKLIASEKQFRYSMDHMLEGVQIIDFDWKFIYVNEALLVHSKYSSEELLGHTVMEKYPGVENTSLFKKYEQCLVERQILHFENEFLFPDSSTGYFELSFQPVPEGMFILSVDITERKKAELLLRDERDKLAIITETSPGLIYSFKLGTDGAMSFVYVSNAVMDILGFTQEEALKDMTTILQLRHNDDVEDGYIDMYESAKKLTPWHKEFRYHHPIKGLVWLEGNSIPVAREDGAVIWHGIINDITERKNSEKKIIKASRLYLFISQVNQMIVRTTDEKAMFEEACKIAVEFGGFRMAWIGMVDEFSKKIIPVQHAGEENGYSSAVKAIAVEDAPEGRGPSGMAVRENRFVVSNDIEHDPQMAHWRQAAISRGYLSSIAVPIKKFDKVAGVFNFYSSEKNFFDEEEIALLLEATGDVSFALENFEKEVLRKKAEKAVLESEQRYHTLAETLPVGIFHMDANGATTYVNPCWRRISGLSFQEALGHGWINAVHKDDREQLINGWSNNVTGQHNSFSAYRFVRPDGSISWVMGNAIPETNTKGEVVGYVGTITDVTEHKIAEDLILKQKQLTDTVINNLPGIFYLYDEEGNFIRWNKNFENVTGFSGSEISKMHPLDFYVAEEKNKINNRIKTVFEKRTPGIEVTLLTKTKQLVPYFINSLKIDYEGKNCLLGMGLDLTEPKKAEKEINEANERYELIGKVTSDGVWDLNVTTDKVWANEMHQHLYGLTLADAVPDHEEWVKRIHADDRQRVTRLLDNAKLTGAKSLVDEYRFYSDTKGWINILSRILIERDNSGKPLRMIGSMMDITERKVAEDKLNEKNVQLQSLSDNLPGVMLYQLTANLDGTRKFNYVSNGSLAITGKTPQEIIDDPAILYSLINQDDLQMITIAEKEAMKTRKIFNVEVRRRNHKGETRWLNTISSPRELNDGKVVWDGFYVDITERKLAEEIIINSNKRLEQAEELAGLGSWEFDVENKTVKWSKQLYRLFGIKEDTIPPSLTALAELIGEKDREAFIQNIENLQRGIEPSEVRVFCTNAAHTPLRYLQTTFSVDKKEDGKVVKFKGTVLDITENILYEQRLLASEEKYRVLVEEASDGIFISDETGRFITVNASACKLCQCKEEDLLQMTIYDFFVAEDVKRKPIEFEALRQGTTVVNERLMKRSDGQYNHFEITSKLLTDGRLLSLVRDIAERKKGEEAIRLSIEKYNMVAKATNDSIWDLDIVTGKITRTGDGFKILFGYDAENQIKSDPELSKLVHPDDLTATRASMTAAFEKPDVFYWAEEYRLLKANGEYAHVYDKGYIIRDANGKAIRMIGATQDITNLKENEINLKKLNKDLHAQAKALADSNAELEQFAYVASHDLQEPLRMVTSFLSLLEIQYAGTFDAKGKTYIHFAVDGAKRMRQIILDLLEISKVGRSQDNIESLDLNIMVGETRLLLQHQIVENIAVIEVDKLPVVHAYRSSMMQVFQNLLGNSIKYKREGIAPHIKINAVEKDDHWQICVADNGIGIEKEYYHKIFVIFQRLHNQNQFSGTGIGLAITKKIIENMGGKIWLESSPGIGTTFYFTLKK